MNILKVIKDFWEVLWTKSVFKDTDFMLLCILFGMSLGTCCVCIVDYNTLGLTGWITIASYWFIEIAKLNNKNDYNS